MIKMRFALLLGSAVGLACSSADDVGPAPAGDTGGVDTTTPTDTMAKDDTTPPPTDTTPPPTDTTPPPTDTGPASCGAATISSTLGPAAIVRVSIKLGAGMSDMTGPVYVKLSHYRGTSGVAGVFHSDKTWSAVALSATKSADVAVDMAPGGAMWTEQVCEFNLDVFVDKNGNKVADPGEPAGTAVVSVSCKATASPCVAIELGCTTGASCLGKPGTGACTCGAACTPASIGKFCL